MRRRNTLYSARSSFLTSLAGRGRSDRAYRRGAPCISRAVERLISCAHSAYARRVTLRRPMLGKAVCAVLAVGAATAGAWAIVAWAESAHGTLSCSWPLRVRGTATSTQVGLARCYVRALANRDHAEMAAVARDLPPAHITTGLFRYSSDARAGLATATFTPNPSDSTYLYLTVRFADGTIEHTGMLNMVAMGGDSQWRMDIGQPGEPAGQ